MISKHIDLIGIAVLLVGAALYTGTRELTLVQIKPYKVTGISQVIGRAMRCNRAARVRRDVNINRAIVIPAPPAPPIEISTN